MSRPCGEGNRGETKGGLANATVRGLESTPRWIAASRCNANRRRSGREGPPSPGEDRKRNRTQEICVRRWCATTTRCIFKPAALPRQVASADVTLTTTLRIRDDRYICLSIVPSSRARGSRALYTTYSPVFVAGQNVQSVRYVERHVTRSARARARSRAISEGRTMTRR